nr:abscisic acid 8'-hydroxylase 3 [Lilium davidii]
MLPPLPLSLQFLSLLVIALSVLWLLKISTSSRRRTKTPPGSSRWPVIGETLAFIAANSSGKGFYDFVRKRYIRYGGCFKTNIFRETHVFVSTIEAARAILSSDATRFSKRYLRSIAELLGDQSLLCASHEQHRLVRGRLSSILSVDCMASVIRHFDKLTVKALGGWKERDTVVVLDDTLKITFNAILKMLISLEEEDELEILRKDVHEVSEAMLVYPLKLPGTRFYKGLKARKRIMDTLKKKIALRRAGLECSKDLLQSLLMSDDSLLEIEILDNILTLILAGQITTSSAIAWMVKYLDENPEVQERARVVQLETALKIPMSTLELGYLNEMPYVSKVVKETLRMATIVSWFPRVALKDCEVEGFEIRKGWIVNVDARSIHYDPTIYKDPGKFDPSRFDEEHKPYGYLAFGTGGTTCLGMNLAKAMMMVFLHRLVTTYRWEVIDPDSSLEKWAMFPRLRSGCPIRVTALG